MKFWHNACIQRHALSMLLGRLDDMVAHEISQQIGRTVSKEELETEIASELNDLDRGIDNVKEFRAKMFAEGYTNTK